jgi:hypothetical protein
MRYYQLISLFFIFLFGSNVYSQHRNSPRLYPKNEIKAGVGLEQGFNVGFNRFYCKNCNFGLGLGSHFPSKKQTHHLLLNTENNFHFVLPQLRKTEPSILFNQQIMFWRYSEPDFKHQAVTFGLNTGCRFTNINNFGFIFEFGPSITYTLKFEKVESSTVEPITKKFQSNFRILVFQRF